MLEPICFLLCCMAVSCRLNARQAEPQLERSEQPVQSSLCWIVAAINGAQQIRTRHTHLGCEFFHSRAPDYLRQRNLNRDAFVHRR